MPRVVFRLRPLRGEELEGFLGALDFQSLEPHLEEVAGTPGGVSLRRTLRSIRERGELLVMYVEDYGTEGLTGDESEGESHFRALCKDTLFSHKRDEAAGGSYGLGKSVLWIFSGLSTVLFDSTLIECPAGRLNPRFIGRAELASHVVGGEIQRGAFAGPGWLGLSSETAGGARAESLWDGEAREHARGLGFREREDHDIGTSICIVGFRDPTADEEPTLERLVERTRAAVAEYFWPAMNLEMRRLVAQVGVGDELTSVTVEETDVAPFLEAWRGRAAPREELEQPGDVVVRAISFRVPPTRDGEAGVEGQVELVVRLDSERRSSPRNGQVAVFRGPGMVVRYWDRSRIALGMRPFHAVLACGVARDPKASTDADRAVERFLRLAEPPSHDDWKSTQRLKETYKRGYAAALTNLQASVDEALRALLVVGPTEGRRGPERLQRRFPIGKKGAADKRPTAFHIHGLSATLGPDGWEFSGAIEPARPGHPWSAELRLAEEDERGKKSDSVSVLKLDIEGEAAIRIEEGVAVLTAPAETDRLAFRGRTAPSPCFGALEVEIVGRVHEGGES